MEARLADLEGRFESLRKRVERLEVGGVPRAAVQLHEEEEHAALFPGAEYTIGAKVVPRLGALLVILAIAFMAVLEGSKSTSIDRGLLLALEALLCVAFIVVGEWKRNELEGFGITLTSIGACGLYLTAAGGHFAYQTLSGASMAGLFALFTLGCHAYAIWRTTRLFFFIGASGGLAGMLFPLAEQDFSSALGVYVAVTVAGAAVCAIRKWPQLVIAGWLFGLLILVPIVDSGFSRTAILAALYCGSLACIAAYAYAQDADALDSLAIGAPVALMVTAGVGVAVQPGLAALPHLFALSAVGVVAGALLSRIRKSGGALTVGSLAVLGILGPTCLERPATLVAYCAVAVACLAFRTGSFARLAAAFSLVEVLLATAAYVALASAGTGFGAQTAYLGAIALAVGSAGAMLPALGVSATSFVAASFFVLLGRWAYLGSLASGFGCLSATAALYAFALLWLGLRLRNASLKMWSFAIMCAGVVAILGFDRDAPAGVRLLSLLALGVMMLSGGYRYVHDTR